MPEASIPSQERVSVAGAVAAVAVSVATTMLPPAIVKPAAAVPTERCSASSVTERSVAFVSVVAPTVASTRRFETAKCALPVIRSAMFSVSTCPETSSLAPLSVSPEPGTVDQSSAVASTGALAVPAPSAS